MLYIAYIVISLDQTLEIKEETRLLLKGLKIGKRKRSYIAMWSLTIVHIIMLDEKCEALLNQKQSIITIFGKQPDQ
jgi:hypothetical protein